MAQTKYDMPVQVTAISDTPLIPMYSQGKVSLAYELQIVNMGPTEITLSKITVANSKGERIGSFEGDPLKTCLSPADRSKANPTVLVPGKLVVAYLWLNVNASSLPDMIGHTLVFGDRGERATLPAARMKLLAKRGLTIQAPLRGTNWVASNGPSNTSGHRRARLCMDGHASIGQRYAIDWLQINSKGQTFAGDEKDNASYFCYDEDVLACADAKVVRVVDGVKQNEPHNPTYAVVMTSRTLPGNHVILDLGKGYYAAYAHMIPGSIRVKAGDQVKVGQVIGKLGNSGNSSEPHLHFQIMNAPDFLASEGLPYGYQSIWVRDTKVGTGAEIAIAPVGPVKTLKNEMPLEDQFVSFSGR